MKKRILIIALLIGGLAFQQASAQLRISLRANIGTQPIWGPTGYDHVEYYYLPDIDAYYYVPTQQYIYMERGRWTFRTSLPSRYSNYDINSGYKVVINDRKPYQHADMYRQKYSGYRNNHSQQFIRDSHEQRYYENRNHPHHDEWQGNRNNGNRNNGNRGNDQHGRKRN